MKNRDKSLNLRAQKYRGDFQKSRALAVVCARKPCFRSRSFKMFKASFVYEEKNLIRPQKPQSNLQVPFSLNQIKMPFFNFRKPSADPVSNIMEEMRASPASTSPVSAQTQQERTAAARRAEERAAEQERRRREAVSIYNLFFENLLRTKLAPTAKVSDF